MRRKFSGALCAVFLLSLCFAAAAEEPLFGWVYTTDLLPQGKYEVAQWLTGRDGKPVGQYEVVEGRTEIEYGVSDRLQVATYLNYEWADAYHDDVRTGATLPPATLSNLYVGANVHLDTTRFTSVSIEGIYRALSPYLDPLGLAIYLRPSVGPQLGEVEARVILQKNFLDDRWVVALNIGDTLDWRDVPSGPGSDGIALDRKWGEESTLALGLASSYRFTSGWSAGVELENERGYSAANPFDTGARTGVAYYSGPTLHYADRHLFATLNYLTQLPFARDYADPYPGFDVDGRNYSAGNERFRLRLKLGWYF